FAQAVRNGLALDPLHRKIRRPVFVRAAGDVAHDSRMREAREDGRLPPKAIEVERRAFYRVEDLQRDRLPCSFIACIIHEPVSALSGESLDDEAPCDTEPRLHCEP